MTVEQSKTGSIDLFRERLAELGVKSYVEAGLERALERVMSLTEGKTVSRWKCHPLDELDLQDEAAESAELSLVVAGFAVADTGTIGLVHGAAQATDSGLLPTEQLILINARDIRETLAEALSTIYSGKGPQDVPSNIALVTGPSRTVDIGLTPITGVHSPKDLKVVIEEK